MCTSGRGRCGRWCLSNTWSCSADVLMITIQVQLPLYLKKCRRLYKENSSRNYHNYASWVTTSTHQRSGNPLPAPFPAESDRSATVGWTLACTTDIKHLSYLHFHLTLIIPYHPFNFSPEVFREQAFACPEAPHQLGPVAWQTTKSPQCWWGLIQGGVLHCWGW